MNEITKTIMESLENYDKNLDEWLESEDHRNKCASWNESLCCCLDVYEKDNFYGADGRGFSKSHLLQSQIKVIEAVIEELKQRKELNRGPFLKIDRPYNQGIDKVLEDQISSLTQVKEELIQKNV